MKIKLSLAVLAAICFTSASAMSFQTLGYKSVAMGGAGVASSAGSTATYNNPALLAKTPYDVEVSLGAGASVYDHGVGASFKALDDSGFIDTINKVSNDTASLTTADQTNLVSGKNIVLAMDGNAIEISPQGYFSVQVENFGIGVFASSDIVGTAVVDQAHNKLIFENSASPGTYYELNDDGTQSVSNATAYTSTSIEYAVNNGLTYVQATGVILGEVPIAYGHKFELSAGKLMLGGAAKYMQATTYSEKLQIDNSGSLNSSEKKDKTTSNFGVDLGIAYEPSFSNDLTLGIVGKNLNSPDFEFADGSTYSVEPMIRLGVAYNIFESLEFAADMDLTQNKTFVSGVDSQMVGGGLNWHPASWFALRGGVMQNLDNDDKAGLIYTAGLGFGPKWFQLDLSAQLSPKTTNVNGTEFPQYAKVNLALISRW